jgi:hypothetical protein
MPTEWTLFIQEEVKANQFIPIPKDVLSKVGYNHDAFGPVIYWNYERNANYIILSNYALRGENYKEIKRTEIYDIEDINEGRGRIKLPNAVDEKLKSYYLEGTRVNFMAYEEMVDGENPSVFLLPNKQMRQLIPAQARNQMPDDSEAAEIRQSLMEIPAFLPTP